VASRPASNPARANRNDPVQTDAISGILWWLDDKKATISS
jgi:hypothetical protein